MKHHQQPPHHQHLPKEPIIFRNNQSNRSKSPQTYSGKEDICIGAIECMEC